jgi:pimeloyl-ACP methyl ester carboxylesterase
VTRHDTAWSLHRPRSDLLVLVVALAVVVASCSSDSADPATTTEDSTAPSATVVVVPETVCGQELTAGFQRIDCEEMSFDVAVPEVCDGAGCGLIIDVHGYRANGPWAERHTGMQGIGNAAGYVVVQPNSPQFSWNHETDDDRVRSFMDRLIDGLSLNRNRVHIGGFSQGGWLTWRFVCDHSDLIASAAPAGAGASYPDDEPVPGVSCDFDADGSPAQQVDIFYTHGTEDHDQPFETAIQQRDLVIASWDMAQESVLADESDYRWTRWTNAQGTVFEFLEHDWQGAFDGHCYPGAAANIGCGTETPVHYGEAALQFYIDHPKSE